MIRKLKILKDPRMPYFTPVHAIRKNSLMKDIAHLTAPAGINIHLSFDVEQDYGSLIDEEKYETSKDFFEKLDKNLSNYSYDFFIQLNFLRKFYENLNEFRGRASLGFHCFDHNRSWGNYQWFIKDRPLSYQEKFKILFDAKKTFMEYGFEAPEIFRAPNMIVNDETIKLLQIFNYKLDSSAPAFIGTEPIVRKSKNFIQIPVTANPIPIFTKRPYFEMLTISGLVTADNETFLNNIYQILKFQILSKTTPHLVFLAHPWEFAKNNVSGLEYCSEDNWKHLKDKINLLEDHFQINSTNFEKYDYSSLSVTT